MAMLIILVRGFIVGIVFVSTAKTGSVKPIIITTIIGLVLGVIVSMIRVVPAGYVGVVDVFGAVAPQPLASGINFVNPLARVIILSVRSLPRKG
jgi:regulator of protease activity HflC (stomatin/prohibitin superfamily)